MDSNVAPIRPDVPVPATVQVQAMDEALCKQLTVLFQAMGIVRMASREIQRDTGDSGAVDAWTLALDGAYELLQRHR